ncbi:MAG: hypothetical protein K8R58_10105 [Bacteroidales bacterium]|nr:hypothetical protein [Bacteroidales bacterium]
MKKSKKLFIIFLCQVFLLFHSSTIIYADVNTVNGFTDVAVQQAINIFSPGDTIFFPPGEYLFVNTVTVNKSLALLGASGLQDVCVVDPGEPNEPPYWEGIPSFCHAENGDVDFFEVEAENVEFKNLKLKGQTTHQNGVGTGISFYESNYFDPGCRDLSVGGTSWLIDFGDPAHNGVYVPQASLHDIYIGNNINDTDPEQHLIWVDNYVYSKEDEGSTLWSDITGTEGLYIDGSNTTWDTNGSHCIHLITRFKLLEQAAHRKWQLYAYVSDMDNNLPISAWYENQEGWPIYVDSSNTVFIETAPLFQDILLYNNYPNPFNYSTTISYRLAVFSKMIINIYNLSGQEIRTLVNKNQAAR